MCERRRQSAGKMGCVFQMNEYTLRFVCKCLSGYCHTVMSLVFTEIKIAFRKPKEASLFPFVCIFNIKPTFLH